MQYTHTHTILFYVILSLTCFGSDSAFIRKVKLTFRNRASYI